MLRTFGQLLYNILQRESIILQDIALKCYMRLAGPLRLNFFIPTCHFLFTFLAIEVSSALTFESPITGYLYTCPAIFTGLKATRTLYHWRNGGLLSGKRCNNVLKDILKASMLQTRVQSSKKKGASRK